MIAGVCKWLTKCKNRVSSLPNAADLGIRESIAVVAIIVYVVVSITTVICVSIIVLYCNILKFKNNFFNCIITYIYVVIMFL